MTNRSKENRETNIKYWTMPDNFGAIIGIFILVFMCMMPASSENKIEPDVQIIIGTDVGDVGQTVDVPVTIVTSGARPSTILMAIEFDESKLTYVDLVEGIASTNAGKNVQGRVQKIIDKQGDTIEGLQEARFVILGGTGIIEDGTLFDVRFEISDGPIGDHIPLLAGQSNSIATPWADNINVSIVDGFIAIGTAPAMPANVTASDNRGDGINIQWDPVEGTDITYKVYRATEEDPGASVPLFNEWITETQYLDSSVIGEIQNRSTGCLGLPTQPDNCFYYWVKAKNTEDYDSEYSDSARGCLLTNEDEKSYNTAGIVPFRLIPSCAYGDILVMALAAFGLLILAGRCKA